MKTHQSSQNRTVYVGFLAYRPHVQQSGARTISVYLSAAAAKRAYADVRTARLVFDADTSRPDAPEEPRP